MKILHLIDSGGLYGAEKMLLTLVSEQLTLGLEPMILSVGAPGISEKPLEIEARRLGLPVRVWRMSPGLNLLQAGKVIKWAQDQSYDLMHSHGYKFNILAGIWPQRLRRLPLVTTLHGYVRARRLSKMWLYELLDRLVLKRMDAVVLVNDAMQAEISQLLRASARLRVIPNGIDLRAVENTADQPLENRIHAFLADHAAIVLAVGRLSYEKGFDRLIEAFSRLNRDLTSVGLLIVGEGPERRRLEQMIADRGLENQCFMPGYVSNVPALLSAASVLVIPSRTEGLPITLLEGMGVGVPVVATPVGAMRGMLEDGENGYLVTDASALNIERAIRRVLNEREEAASKARSAQRLVETHYSAQAMAQAYLKVYRELPNQYQTTNEVRS